MKSSRNHQISCFLESTWDDVTGIELSNEQDWFWVHVNVSETFICQCVETLITVWCCPTLTPDSLFLTTVETSLSSKCSNQIHWLSSSWLAGFRRWLRIGCRERREGKKQEKWAEVSAGCGFELLWVSVCLTHAAPLLSVRSLSSNRRMESSQKTHLHLVNALVCSFICADLSLV